MRRREADGTIKRGVVFIREFVSRPIITLVANRIYEEPYATLPTRHRIRHTPGSLDVGYEWRCKGQWQGVKVHAASIAQEMSPGSEEEFLTEHYWSYTKRSNGTTSEYEVKHLRWQTYAVRNYEIRVEFAQLYGSQFGFLTETFATSALLAEGSAVSVGMGARIETPQLRLPP